MLDVIAAVWIFVCLLPLLAVFGLFNPPPAIIPFYVLVEFIAMSPSLVWFAYQLFKKRKVSATRVSWTHMAAVAAGSVVAAFVLAYLALANLGGP